jgi:hypothetical protein
MMDMNELVGKLPPELRSIVRNGPQLKAPVPEIIRAIQVAGPGEHQDRLWTLACKQSIEAFWAYVDFIVASHGPELRQAVEEVIGHSIAPATKAVN